MKSVYINVVVLIVSFFLCNYTDRDIIKAENIFKILLFHFRSSYVNFDRLCEVLNFFYLCITHMSNVIMYSLKNYSLCTNICTIDKEGVSFYIKDSYHEQQYVRYGKSLRKYLFLKLQCMVAV